MQYAEVEMDTRVRVIGGAYFGQVGIVSDAYNGWVYVRVANRTGEGPTRRIVRASQLMLASDRTGVCTGWDLHPVEVRCERIDTVPCEWCREPRCPAHREAGSTGLHCPYPRHA